jgi:uncharacterized protein (TIGR01777 family)
MRIVITGGTGLVGTALSRLLKEEGHEVFHISRGKDSDYPSYQWDLDKGYLDPEALENKDVLVHLAGAGVADSRWTARRKQVILNSRTQSAALLVQRLQKAKQPPAVLLSASAVGFYGGDTAERLCREDDAPGNDFLAKVCVAWEEAILPAQNIVERLAILRIGVVLSKDGGALPKLLQPPVAAPLGSGAQYMSTIHIEDLARMFLHAMITPEVKGVYNAVGPEPLSNRDFSKLAAQVAGKPYVPLPVPAFGLKLLLGEMSQVVLGGNKVSAEKIRGTGFEFQYPQVAKALEAILKT